LLKLRLSLLTGTIVFAAGSYACAQTMPLVLTSPNQQLVMRFGIQPATNASSEDGRLIYSTCSLEHEENEAVVESAIADTMEFKIGDMKDELEKLRLSGEFASELDLSTLLSGRYLRTIPGIHPCDGFFSAIIERR